MKGLLGGIMIAIGILIMGASGLCSATVLSTVASGELVFWAIVVAIFGGTPFVGGIALVLAGRHVMRRAREDEGSASQNSGTMRK